MRASYLNPRIIYVAPFLSIIDQNFEVFKEALGSASSRSDLILAHNHLCEMVYKNEENEFSTDKSELLIEAWNSEIIVTTLIQFGYTILGCGSKELRKFHNLAGSIVILDEVQAIPAEYWNLIRQALKFLSQNYQITFILMTATQPLIFDRQEVTEILDGDGALTGEETCTLDVSDFKYDETRAITIEQFAHEILKSLNSILLYRNVMVVVNTISSACALFDKLEGKLTDHDLFYLSAEVTPKERKDRLASLLIQMRENRQNPPKARPVFLVTTQLIEAGVDIDFDLVFRDLAPFDSIIQSAGRCNRHGLRPRDESVVKIFKLVDDAGIALARKVYGNVSIQKTEDMLASYNGETFRELSDLYYNKMRSLRSQKKEQKILDGILSLDYEKLQDFKLIDEDPRGSIFIELDRDASRLFEQFNQIWKKENMERGESRREFLRIRPDFYRYVINVPDPYLSHLNDPIHGIYLIERDDIPDKYDNKGFVRNPIGLI